MSSNTDARTATPHCRHAHGAASSATCRTCPKGSFSGATGVDAADKCNDCPPGKRGTVEGAVAVEDCENCNAGKFAEVGGQTECERCVGGTSNQGSSYCKDCEAGTFLNNDATTCTKCDPGSISKAGASSCTPCGSGTYQNGTDCEACIAGRYGATEGLHTALCSGICPAGTHSFRYATKCTPCDGGKHAPHEESETCAACPMHRTSEAGAAECGCEPGRYEMPDGNCTLCTDGMECGLAGTSLGAMSLTEGHWRLSAETSLVLSCTAPDACMGGANATADDGCLEGNEGVLCAVCAVRGGADRTVTGTGAPTTGGLRQRRAAAAPAERPGGMGIVMPMRDGSRLRRIDTR